MKKLLLVSLCFLMLCVTQVFAQNRVTGTVTAKEDGLPIPGATVRVKGTSTAVATDVNGKYSIAAPANSTLVFSYIAYASQEIAVNGRTAINVVLIQGNKQLNEVVVTSFGISRQTRSLGASVGKVSNEEVTQKSEPDLLKNMEGRVAGVDIRASQSTPGAATRIQIRGNTSFLGDNQPLIVVDGVPYSNDQITTSSQTSGGTAYGSGIANLDPNDIANIQILKGSGAAALYGSRASNGVLIITTKSGSANRSKKGLEVTLKSSASIEQIASLPTYQNSYGPGAYFSYSNSNGSWGPAFDTAPTAATASGLLDVNGVTSIPAWPSYANPYPNLFPGGTIPYKAVPNNVKDLFHNGALYENSISINGGDEKNSVSLTASQVNDNGYIPNSNYERSNLSLGGVTKTAVGLNVRGNLAYTRSTQKGGYFGENQVDGAASEFARTLFLARNWNIAGLPYQDLNGNPITPNGGGQFDNPIWSELNNVATTAEERFIANMKLDYDVTKWLNLSYAIGSNVNTLARREIIEIGSRAAKGLGSLTEDNYRNQEIESTFLASLHPKLGGDFTVEGFLGANFNQRTSQRNVDFGNQFIQRGTYNLTNTLQPKFVEDDYFRHRIYGLFGEGTLGYHNYAFLTLTGRNDWSSTLPVNNRSYFYYSAQGSFVFTDALKIKSDVLDYGKIRASYAKVGRDADPYETGANTFTILSNFLSNPTGANTTSALDPNLKPEFTAETEIGTELSFFNQRINLDVAWYNKNTTNAIFGIPTPPSTGYAKYFTNLGSINNKGIEVSLTLKPVRSREVTWSITGNLTRNINTVTALKAGVQRVDLGEVLTTLSTYAEAGMPYGYLRGTTNYRDGKGNLLINPTTGDLIENTDQSIIGNPNPKYKLGVDNVVTYKGFNLGVLFDMTVGGDISSETVNTYLGRGVTKDTQDRLSDWVISGYYADPNTGKPILDGSGHEIPNVTRITTNDLYFASDGNHETFGINGAAEWAVYDATVYRLREVTLGYTIPKTLYQKTPIGSINISVSGRNLWYYTPHMPKYANFDPETNSFGASNVQGIELSGAPSVRRYGLNLTVTF